jgi:hypothetical protein
MDSPFGLKRDRGTLTTVGVERAILVEESTFNNFVNVFKDNLSQFFSELPGVTDSRGRSWIRPPAYCQRQRCVTFVEYRCRRAGVCGIGNPDNLKYLSQIGGVDCTRKN